MRFRLFLAVSLAVCLPLCMMSQDRAALSEMFVQAAHMESKDAAGADKLYEKAASQGYAPAEAMLGYRLLYGIGEPQDLPRAFSLFSAGTKAGNLDAQFLLALCYLQGLATPKNPTAARDNLLDPADKGNQFAQYTLGIMMVSGEGGPKREAAARRWLDRAASGPNVDLAGRAANFRDKLDAQLFASNNSTGVALTALAFIVLFAAATNGGGSGGGGGGGSYPSSDSTPFGGGSGGVEAPPVRPTPFYPDNISKAVNGDLTDPNLGWR